MIKQKKKNRVTFTNPQIKRVADLVIHNTETDIFKECKQQPYVDARALFDYLMRVEYNQTYVNIRNYYLSKKKKRHHASIIYSVNNFKDVVFRNPHFLDIIEVIKIQEVSPRQINNLIIEVSKINTKKQLGQTREFLKKVLAE